MTPIVGLTLSEIPMPDLEALIKLGFRTFYFGITFPEWQQKFNRVLLAHRDSNGLATDFLGLVERLAILKEKGCQYFLSLDAPFYPDSESNFVETAIQFAEKNEVKGIIISDLNLVVTYTDLHIPFYLSSAIDIQNPATLSVLNQPNIKGVFLPTKSTLTALGQIIHYNPNKTLEIGLSMWARDCLFGSGQCQSDCHMHRVPLCRKVMKRKLECDVSKDLEFITSLTENTGQHAAVQPISEKDQIRFLNRSSYWQNQGIAYADDFPFECGLCAWEKVAPLAPQYLDFNLSNLPIDEIHHYSRVIQKLIKTENPTPKQCQSALNRPGMCQSRSRCLYQDALETKESTNG